MAEQRNLSRHTHMLVQATLVKTYAAWPRIRRGEALPYGVLGWFADAGSPRRVGVVVSRSGTAEIQNDSNPGVGAIGLQH